MIELQPLATCSFVEAVALWNEGFKGYPIDLSWTLDDFVARLHNSGLSVEKSLVANIGGKHVGFLLNGFRNHAGKLVAWNGGTGVIPEFRKQGIGRILVEGALQRYADEKVDYATLEAISTNAPAIALYRSCGYETVAELTFLQHDGPVNFSQGPTDYLVEDVTPALVSGITFYESFVPWQAHWQSMNENGGQASIAYDRERSPFGYALFRKKFDDHGNLKNIALHDCVVDPARADSEVVALCLLRHVFSPLSVECRRSTHNFMKSNHVVLNMLQQTGFTTFIEQVLMKRDLG